MVDGDDVQGDANVVDVAGVREEVGAEGLATLEGVAELGLDAEGEDEGEDGGDAREADEDAVEAAGRGWGWGASSAVVFVVAVGGVGWRGRRAGGRAPRRRGPGMARVGRPVRVPNPGAIGQAADHHRGGVLVAARRGGGGDGPASSHGRERVGDAETVASASRAVVWAGGARGGGGALNRCDTGIEDKNPADIAARNAVVVIDTPPGERRGWVAQHRPCKVGSDRLLIRPR